MPAAHELAASESAATVQPVSYPVIYYPPLPPSPHPRSTPALRAAYVVIAVLRAWTLIAGGIVVVDRARLVAATPVSATVDDPGASAPAVTPTPTPSPTPTAYTGDLRKLLLKPPATSRPFAKPISKDGNLNQAQAAALFTNPTRAAQLLTEEHFVIGAVEQWHDKDNTEVDIQLFQFADGGADAWLDLQQLGYGGDSSLAADGVIDGVTGSACFVDKKADSIGFVQTLGIASRNDIFMIVAVFQPNKANRPSAITIMKSQYTLLP
jgi:hypothetical protein